VCQCKAVPVGCQCKLCVSASPFEFRVTASCVSLQVVRQCNWVRGCRENLRRKSVQGIKDGNLKIMRDYALESFTTSQTLTMPEADRQEP
jgi:hypothetical protein